MKVVLLAGGLGTRIREETEFRPKPMVQVGEFPLIWHIMKYFSTYSYSDFVICTGYKGEIMRNFFRDYKTERSDFTISLQPNSNIQLHDDYDESHWNVTLANTGALTPTGGRIHKVRKYLQEEHFICTYGDGLANVNIKELLKFHFSHGRIATVTAVQPVSRFGVLDVDSTGSVLSFREKPQSNVWVNAGFFVFSPKVFSYLDENSVLENEPLANLAQEGQLMAFNHSGFWQPMDTFRELTILNELWNTGKAPWKTWN